MQLLVCALLVVLLSVSGNVMAWGERGHDLITRVAVVELAQQTDNDPRLMRPFQLRDHMLSHLANVPDIVWRAEYMSDRDRSLNVPTHYINLDKLYPLPANVYEVERDLDVVKAQAAEQNMNAVADLGSAPWRVIELQARMAEALRQAGAAEDRESFVDAVNQALLYAGVMSHFVGDLANPHHTTLDYNGVLTGNRGLHAYFESIVVAALPLTLPGEIDAAARQTPLTAGLLASYTEAQQQEILADPSLLIFALMTDSHQNVRRLVALDDQYAVLERSTERMNAYRRPAEDVMDNFKPLVVERLAVGANVLAQLWRLAWIEAGEPNLAHYASYEYPVQPEFIVPSYL